MGRIGDFIDTHIVRAQHVVALVTGLIVLGGFLIGGATWLVKTVNKPDAEPADPQANFTVAASVRETSANRWSQGIRVEQGARVEVLVTYENTGNIRQDDVLLKVALDRHVNFVPGSTYIANSRFPDGVREDVEAGRQIVMNGLNVGSYNPNGDAFVKFEVTVDAQPCSVLRNLATAITENGKKQNFATITVIGASCSR